MYKYLTLIEAQPMKPVTQCSFAYPSAMCQCNWLHFSGFVKNLILRLQRERLALGVFCGVHPQGDLWMRTAADRPSAWQAALSTGVTETRGPSTSRSDPRWAHTLSSRVTDGIQPPSSRGLQLGRGPNNSQLEHTCPPSRAPLRTHMLTWHFAHMQPTLPTRGTSKCVGKDVTTHKWVYPFINKDESPFPLPSS